MAESLRIEKTLSNFPALILAGGKGERLSPLTTHRAKPLFCGKYRVPDFTPGNCINSIVVIPIGAEIR